ncbi:LigB-domain-containing protein [Ascobolus immersus RN42]|uniref:LigB-domain-containing protein n=1 Tax=Ascobolus immersus RN42 TaxID=1160509 RepID=A0A3N4IA90_ASCIM|nr:LigB-domain-containing protein [Ascobolus immersus RN42]
MATTSSSTDNLKVHSSKENKITKKKSASVASTITLLLSALAVAIVAVLLTRTRTESTTASTVPTDAKITTTQTSSTTKSAPTSTMAATTPARRLPIYFVSHGGVSILPTRPYPPNIMYDHDHPVYPRLQALGKEITEKVKPKAVVVLSAHWQAGESGSDLAGGAGGLKKEFIEVNVEEKEQPLIYDFYNFPAHYYKEKYPHRGSKQVSSRVLDLLKENNISATGTKRGLDHGVWAVFRCMFNPTENPLNVPLVQVSLFPSESPDNHIALGKALAPLRDEGVLIVASGMAVHNLRELWTYMSKPGSMAPYTKPFDDALTEAVVRGTGEEREGKLVELLRRQDARKAHPTFEHILPVHVAAGAAAGERGKKLFDMPQGSMAWSMFRFGEVPAEA